MERYLNNKDIWRNHCSNHSVPIYFQPWWLDTVCGENNWGICIVKDQENQVEGALVYFLKSKYGLKVITSPPITTYSGLWLNIPPFLTKPASRKSFENKVSNQLIKQLPFHHVFYQHWHPSISNWLPFFWQGFRQTTLYTYKFDCSKTIESIYENLSQSCRTDIRKSSDYVFIKEIENPKIAYNLYCLSLKRNSEKPRFSEQLFCELDNKLKKRGKRKILVAEDETGNLHSMLYLIQDEKCSYFLMSGGNPEFRHSKSMYSLFWEAIKIGLKQSESIDMEGSTLEPVENFLRSFSGELTPHFKIKKSRKWIQILSIIFNKDFH